MVERHNVGEIRIPVLERLELFQRSSGETSDVVEKQMYAFVDRDEAETTLALRPEGTPGVVRAYIEAGMDRSDPEQRFYYVGPMFRRERPQKGRFRQFSQFGVEIFGRADAASDAELMLMVDELRRELGLELNFEINSLGDARMPAGFSPGGAGIRPRASGRAVRGLPSAPRAQSAAPARLQNRRRSWPRPRRRAWTTCATTAASISRPCASC